MIFNMQSGGVVPDQYLEEQTITPGIADQVINAGTYLRGALTILGDPDLIPANIKEGVNIFGVDGTLSEGPKIDIGINVLNKDENGYATDLLLYFPGMQVEDAFGSGAINTPFLSHAENVEIIMGQYMHADAYIGNMYFTGVAMNNYCKKLKIKVGYFSFKNTMSFAFYKTAWVSKDTQTMYSSLEGSYYYGMGCRGGTIYCEFDSKPSSWCSRWNYYATSEYSTVIWGVSESEYDALEVA